MPWRDWQGHDGRQYADITHSHTPYRTTHIYEVAYERGTFRISVTERFPNCSGPDTWFGGRVLWDLDAPSMDEAKRRAALFWRRHKAAVARRAA